MSFVTVYSKHLLYLMDSSQNNKRIAKNTLYLYFRMILLMLVSLYTSRVVLNALGVDDYGIYNVVGGLVAMFSLISSSLTASITRFFTFELGKNDLNQLKKVFSTSVSIQILLSIIVVLVAETLGLWFLNYKMVIPEGRLVAANWCFQLSILTFILSLLSTPYNAAIIAHERMSAFAYISIFEALGKLGVALCISILPIDRLILYSILTTLIACVVRIVYTVYCKKHFTECFYYFILDKSLFKQMFSFAGWNFIGASSHILKEQGCNLLINLFYGPAVNAARGIANSVNTAISGFVRNFMVAIDPQITKSYAIGAIDQMFSLVTRGSRFSYYILLLFTLPILFNTHYILELWLKVVPDHAVLFVQLILINTLLESMSNTLITVMLATGNIKWYQIIVGGLQMLNFPISYVCLYMGMIPECTLIVSIILALFCFIARLIMLKQMVQLDSIRYLKEVFLHALLITLLSMVVPLFINIKMEEGIVRFFTVSIISIVLTSIVVYFIGCNQSERNFINSKIISIYHKLIR